MNFKKNLLIKFVFLSLYINIEKSIRINNIRSPKMLTQRFFFPSIYKLIYIDLHLLSNIFFYYHDENLKCFILFYFRMTDLSAVTFVNMPVN